MEHTEESNDCCKDVPIVFKSDDSHISSQIVYDLNTVLFIPTTFFSHTDEIVFKDVVREYRNE
jgi:hypothetical protein